VYIAGEVLIEKLAQWPEQTAAKQGELSGKKAALIYSALEASPEVYTVVPDKSVRSRMNICFRVKVSSHTKLYTSQLLTVTRAVMQPQKKPG
jgi:phosphoserine aminotransferase